METLQDTWRGNGRKAVKPLSVIIIGAGIGGLTAGIALAQTGHLVQILEKASTIEDVGAGIQVAPNASRILHRLGVLKDVMECATVLGEVSVRRYDSDEEIASFPVMPVNGVKYGAPMSVIHRGDLQRILLKRATELECRISTNHTVIGVAEDFSARVQVKCGDNQETSWLSGDLVVAADGIRSRVRQLLMMHEGHAVDVIATGEAAYRLLIPREKICHDPTLLSMLKTNVAMRYMGPGGHVMAYPLRNNTMYNLVLLHSSEQHRFSRERWATKGSREDMRKFYSGWSPAIRKWIEYAYDDVLEWALYLHPELPTWSAKSTVLLGDACHPMLPYVAQGAANAMEDAAVLATALTCTSSTDLALRIYESVRKTRAEKIASSASATATTLHLPDGPEQRARDEIIKNPTAAAANPDKWNNSDWQDYMWGVDVMAQTVALWKKMTRMSLVKRRHSLQKAYSYTLSMNISASWLRAQLFKMLLMNPKLVISSVEARFTASEDANGKVELHSIGRLDHLLLSVAAYRASSHLASTIRDGPAGKRQIQPRT